MLVGSEEKLDLLVKSAEKRRDYMRFHRALLKDDIMMLPFSV